MSTQNINLSIYHILYENGNDEFLTLTPGQLAGFKRRKGIKKKVLSIKKSVTISLIIKTH